MSVKLSKKLLKTFPTNNQHKFTNKVTLIGEKVRFSSLNLNKRLGVGCRQLNIAKDHALQKELEVLCMQYFSLSMEQPFKYLCLNAKQSMLGSTYLVPRN